jgi:hypothetical protein
LNYAHFRFDLAPSNSTKSDLLSKIFYPREGDLSSFRFLSFDQGSSRIFRPRICHEDVKGQIVKLILNTNGLFDFNKITKKFKNASNFPDNLIYFKLKIYYKDLFF